MNRNRTARLENAIRTLAAASRRERNARRQESTVQLFPDCGMPGDGRRTARHTLTRLRADFMLDQTDANAESVYSSTEAGNPDAWQTDPTCAG